MAVIKLFSVVTTSTVLAWGFLMSAEAQVIPDGTTSTTVDVDGTINNGDRAGSNLFHSFSEFSVPTGGQAFFNNSVDIVNIFSRVTGGNLSNIDGLLGANGTANLFLINPAGIIFGENASLDIGGSFFGSTADSIIFPDGEFSALDADNPTLLTINAPLGLGIRDNPADIVTTYNPTGLSFANFTVNQGQNINLVGGNINLDRSFINAPGGTIELGGLAVSGEVRINSDGSLSFPEELTRADVSLNNGTVVNVAADNGGSIKVNANNLEILGGSTILAGIIPGSQVAEAQAGDITINVTENINLESEDANNPSRIANDVGNFSPIGDLLTIGSAGDITINTKNLEGNGSFQIRSVSNGEGDSGNINITATEQFSMLGIEGAGSGILSSVAPSSIGNGADITITTPSLVLSNSVVATSTIGQGNAGNIFINTRDSISLSNVSQLQAASFGNGDAGNIVIEATTADISLAGENVLVGTVIASSGLLEDPTLQPILESFGVPPVSTGQGGDIIIKGRNLSIKGGASLLTTTAGQATSERLANAGNIQIDVSENVTVTGGSGLQSQTVGQGNAGNVTITAGNIVSFDGNNGQRVSGIFNTVEQLPELLATNFSQQRQGGTINISAQSFSLTNGANINAGTSGQGNGGNILVTANNRILLDGTIPDGTASSGIFNTVNVGAAGDGGGIEVTTNNLEITNGAVINASTSGEGNGDNIVVTANESISLDGTTPNGAFSSGIFNTVNVGVTGDGGGIDVTTNNLEITNGAVINASTSGEGNGGNIVVTANESISLDGTTPNGFSGGIGSEVAVINATGNGGNVEINTNNLEITNGAIISASTRGQGDGGTISVTANESISLDGTNPEVTAVSGILNTVNVGVNGNGGGIDVTTNNLEIANGAVINASTLGEGDGGNIQLRIEDNLILRNNSTISAEAANNADGGNINIDAEFIIGFPSRGFGNDIRTSAGDGSGGDINITVQGLLGFEESRFTAGQQNNTNDIDASSQATGLDGIVSINNPDVNPLQGVNRLPTNPVSAETIATDTCSPTGGKTNLIIKGKGGILPQPTEPFSAESLILDDRAIASEQNPHYIPAYIQPVKTDNGDIYPARGVIVQEDGTVILTAYSINDQNHRVPQTTANCNS